MTEIHHLLEVRAQPASVFAAVTTEVLLQQVHHRPEVTAFFDVDLEQVAQVVHGRCGQAEVALLLPGRDNDIRAGFDLMCERLGIRYRLPFLSMGIDVAKPLSNGGGSPRLHLNISPVF